MADTADVDNPDPDRGTGVSDLEKRYRVAGLIRFPRNRWFPLSGPVTRERAEFIVSVLSKANGFRGRDYRIYPVDDQGKEL